MVVGIAFTLILLVVSLFTGVYDIQGTSDGWMMFFATRVPRTLSLALSGAAMAMCGLVMQLLTQNKFVGPTTAGTTQWAALGLVIVMVFFPHASLNQRMFGAILMAFVGTMIFFAFLRRVTLKSSLIVPIVGIMLGAVVSALATFLALKFDALQQLSTWFAGSFTNIVRGRYEMVWAVLIVTVLVFIMADRFTAAGLGRDIATNIGLNYDRIILLGVGLVAVCTGIISVVIGSLPFVGLIVPNMVSMIAGDNLRSNLPWVCMGGVWILTICDIIGRTIIAPYEIPVSLILSIVGAAGFIFFIMRRRNNV